MQTGIRKIKDFARAEKISIKPQAAEPHNYGGAHYHLNSVVIGKECRLVFYMHSNEKNNAIRLCI
ncbi:hypothetical protein DRJ22_01925 [Candidatus Woesearchaeota archaeon]|nr:MAG: hypothetical protein DRJ22_01925 [Candidatus Woesearchaeota archaeon]